MTEPWPLSAAATRAFMTGRAKPAEALALACKELVLLGAISLRVQPGTAAKVHMSIRDWPTAGSGDLREVLAALRRHCPEGGLVEHVMAALVEHEPHLAEAVLQAAVMSLVTRDLVLPNAKGKLEMTASGKIQRTQLDVHLDWLKKRGLETGVPVPVLLAAQPWRRHEFDEAVRKALPSR